jgi:hypothetical protein
LCDLGAARPKIDRRRGEREKIDRRKGEREGFWVRDLLENWGNCIYRLDNCLPLSI